MTEITEPLKSGMWMETTCGMCGEKFFQKAGSDKYVRRLNCAECREKLGHPTHVKWAANRKQKAQ